MKEKKTTVGERLRPRPIKYGESAFSASTLITTTPAMTTSAQPNPDSAKASSVGGIIATVRPM
jgi:hypothetical protein